MLNEAQTEFHRIFTDGGSLGAEFGIELSDIILSPSNLDPLHTEFHLEIPEPATFSMMALCGMIPNRRRRHFNLHYSAAEHKPRFSDAHP